MQTYTLDAFGWMMRDKVRTGAYERALRQVVFPGAVVVDIGTGTGMLSMLACRAGARKVFAIEPAGIIDLARELAHANGMADRIEFLEDFSTNVHLPERADVIVSDIHGMFPFAGKSLVSIIDARERFLKPGGALIPAVESMWAATVFAPDDYYRHVGMWDEGLFGLNWKPARLKAVNDFFKARLTPSQIVLEPRLWATVDHRTNQEPNVSGSASWQVTSAAPANGLALWFDNVLADGVSISNAPGLPETVYGMGFFPWPETLQLEPGDRVDVEVRAVYVHENYVLMWRTTVHRGDEAVAPWKSFQQSDFGGTLFSKQQFLTAAKEEKSSDSHGSPTRTGHN